MGEKAKTVTVDLAFIRAVSAMMRAQRAYFKVRTQANLREAKAKEKIVIDWLTVLDQAMDLKGQGVVVQESFL